MKKLKNFKKFNEGLAGAEINDGNQDFYAWKKWAMNTPYINKKLIAFLEETPEYFNNIDPSRPNNPTPRSWALAAEEEYFVKSKEENDVDIYDIYTDYVGPNAAQAYMDYLGQ